MVASGSKTSLVSVIIPAYNEEKTVAAVIAAAFGSPIVGEVIVVDDGSDDKTAEVAQAHGAQVIRLQKNLGKGAALSHGVDLAVHSIILFLDADIINLTPETVTRIGQPVLWGTYGMFVGLFDKPRDVLKNSPTALFYISGQRALKKSLWYLVPKTFKHQFQIELALNVFAAFYGYTIGSFNLPSTLKHRIKEEKYGLFFGLIRRAAMVKDVSVSIVKLSAVMVILRIKKTARRAAAYSYITNESEIDRR